MPHIISRYIRKIHRAKGSQKEKAEVTSSSSSTPAKASIQSSASSSTEDDSATARNNKNVAFEEAWRNHLEELTEEEKKNVWSGVNQHISPEMIHDRIVNLDTKHSASVSRKMIGPTLTFLDAVKSFLGLLDTAAQSSPAGPIVMSVVRVIIDAAIKAGTYFDRLSEMLERMPSYFEVLQRYADVSASSPVVHKTLVASYSNILAFFRKAYRVFVDKDGGERRFASARVFVRSQWSPFEGEYGKILSDFEHYNQILRDMALVENFNYVMERRQAIWEEAKTKKDQEREQFLSWVSGDDSEADNDRLYSRRYPAGIGKSVLSSIIIDHLSKITLTDQYALGFWYCKWDDASMDTMASRLVGMFIKQLCRKMFNIPSEILEFYRRFHKEGRTPLFKDHIELFHLCARYFKRIFLVIDALDECKDEQRELILEFLHGLPTSHVKVFLTSRWIQDVEKACVNNAVELPITAYEVKDDIAIFVQHRVPEKLSIQSAELREKVIGTLVEKSGGLFLWVELQLKDLSKVAECDLEDQLQYLPTGLDAMYIRMIRSIKKLPRASSSLARTCMLWVTYAKRPLTGGELKELVSFMASPSRSNKDDEVMSCSSHKHYSSEAITNACFGLFEMDIDSEPVRPVHYSMQEVFSNRTDTKFPDDCRDFFLPSEEVNIQLSMACIRLLLSEDYCWDSARKYCARYFESHILSLRTIPPELEDMLDSLLSADREVFVNILTFRYPYRFCDCCMGSPREIDPSFFVRCTGLDRIPRIASRYPKVILSDRPEEYLQLSCYLGMSDVLEAIIETGADLNYRDQVGYTALDCACLAKQHDIIKRLLDTGAPQRCSSSGADGPVIRAAKMKDFKSVELLLKGGLTVSLSDYIQAIEVDDLEQVNLITTKCGDMDQQENELSARVAIGKGFRNISKFLMNGLDKDALQRVLRYALTASNDKRIRTLALEYNPDWSSCLEVGAHMLKAASFSGDIETMNSLIEHGVNINAPDENNETPLHSAVRWGQIQAAALLLEKGANTNVVSKNYGTLLETAALHTSTIEMMKLLIKNGATVNLGCTERGGPLGVAAAGQDLEKMRFLLANGADINLPHGAWGSPLGTAVGIDCPKSVKFLLDNGAEVDISCPKYGSPLALAAYDGRIETMRLLIDKGADVNRQGGLFGCPLGAASYRGNMKAIRLLLQEGARVNTAGGFYGSPLGAAALEDNIEAMDILFEQGADVNIQGGPFGTPLGIAAWGRAIEYLRPRYTNGLQLLLDKGADVNAPCNLFLNALEVSFFGCHSDAIDILSKRVEKVEPPCPLSTEYETLQEMAKSVEVQKWFLPKQRMLNKIIRDLSR
ncbi:hypothetical protein Plec18170_000854 [Paecilomyces lecythidis]